MTGLAAAVRPRFPALARPGDDGRPAAFLDGPGGSQAPETVIDAIAGRLRGELGTEAGFVATGGWARTIVPFCQTIEEIDDLLTLTGLRLIHERNG